MGRYKIRLGGIILMNDIAEEIENQKMNTETLETQDAVAPETSGEQTEENAAAPGTDGVETKEESIALKL